MNIPLTLRYAAREFRSGLGGFYIFVICLILGVGAIASVQSLAQGLMQSLNADGRYILGGDVAVRTMYRPPTPEQQSYLDRNFTTSKIVETMTMLRSADGQTTAMGELKSVDAAYPLYGALEVGGQPVNAQKSLGDDGVYLEDGMMAKLGVTTGDSVMIGDAAFTVKGIISREPDRISGTRFSIAPRALITETGFSRSGLAGLQGSQAYFTTRLKIADAQTQAQLEEIEAKIESDLPESNFRIRNFYNASPQMERMINRLTLFLTLAGLTTLLIGGVGISNAVKSFLDSKMNNIATLKCMGASQSFVFQVYLTQIFILAAIAIAIGLAAAVGVSAALSGVLAAKFALSHQTGIYVTALLPAAAYGVLITLAFSLWPLGRAVRVSPTDLFRDLVLPAHKTPSRRVLLAIALSAVVLAGMTVYTSYMPRFAMYFVTGTVIAFIALSALSLGLQRILRILPLPKKPEVRLAVVNLTRPGNPSTGIILSLGLGLSVLVGMAEIEYNFSRLLKTDLQTEAPSFFFLDVQPDQRDAFAQLLDAEGRDAIITPSLRGRIVSVNGIPAEQAIVDRNEDWVIRSDRAFTYLAKQPPHGQIVEGSWWPENYSGDPAVSISMDVKRAFDIGVGDKLTINILGQDITASVMNVREIEWTSFTMNYAVTFAPGTLEGAPATYLATAITAPDNELNLQNKIAAAFPNVTSIRVKEAMETAQGIIRAVSEAVSVSAAVTLLAGILVLSASVAASRQRHIYDSVVLKVLGATRRRILATFLLEYALLGMMTVVLAGGLGTLASLAVMKHILDLPWVFGWPPLLATTALCLFVTVAAGFAGTWRVLGQRPAAHLRN